MATREKNQESWEDIKDMITLDALINEIGNYFSSDDENDFIQFLRDEGYGYPSEEEEE